MEGRRMPKTDAQRRANAKWEAKAYKRVVLRVRVEEYDEIAAAIEASGESVNGYILKAIRERMERKSQQ